MIRRLVAGALLVVGLTAGVFPHASAGMVSQSVAATTAQIQLFETEAAAQAHCPTDNVVWLNISSGIYHEKGMRWYGKTKHGAYVCRREADAAGYRDTRNGQ